MVETCSTARSIDKERTTLRWNHLSHVPCSLVSLLADTGTSCYETHSERNGSENSMHFSLVVPRHFALAQEDVVSPYTIHAIARPGAFNHNRSSASLLRFAATTRMPSVVITTS